MKKKKKILYILIAVIAVVLAFTAYYFRGRFVSTSNSISYNPETQNVLIVYFSHANVVGMDAVSSASLVNSNGESKGNTEVIADIIAENVNADIIEIVTTDAYPSDYDGTVDQAKEEKNEDARPALATQIDNIENYDIILLGYPNWWGTIPMPVYTFLEEYDLSGKTIIPFVTHEGSGIGNSVLDIKNASANSDLVKPLVIRGKNVTSESTRNEISDWLEEIGMKIKPTSDSRNEISPTITEENSENISSDPSESGEEQASGNNTLIVYFAVAENSDVDAVSSASVLTKDGESRGVIRVLADDIQNVVGGDQFSIQTSVEYPGDKDDLIDYAAVELKEDVRPKLTSQIDNLEDYDTIFIGYPNWWADLPMVMYSFFDEYDLSGKTIIPFCTHRGSRFSGTINTIQELEPDATVITEGFTVSHEGAGNAASDISEWLKELGY